MTFTIDDQHIISLAQNVFDRRNMGYKDTDHNISARSLTLLIFAVWWGWHCVVDYNPNTSHWCHCCHFLHRNSILCHGNIFRKWFASYFLFICSRAFSNNV